MWNDLAWYLGGFWTIPAVCLGLLAGTGNLRPIWRLLRRRAAAASPAAADMWAPPEAGNVPPYADKIDLSQYTPDGPVRP